MPLSVPDMNPEQLATKPSNDCRRYAQLCYQMPKKAHPFSCKPENRDPPCKMCRQKKGSQCKYVLDEYANQRLAVASSELKLLQLDPNALNRRSSEVKARPLSPLRNRPMEKQQHAQKKPRIDMQQENQPGEPVAPYLLLNAAELVHIFPVPMQQTTPEKSVPREVLHLLEHSPPHKPSACGSACPCPPLSTFAWNNQDFTSNPQSSAKHGRGRAQRRQWRWGRCGRQ